MRTAVFFSGGLDSTYLTWRLLSSTTDEVVAYYVNFDVEHSEDDRSILNMPTVDAQGGERIGAYRISAWYEANLRPMVVARHTIESLRADENGHVALARLAADLVTSGRYDRVAGAWTWDNWGQPCGGLPRLPSYYAARRAFNVAMGKPFSAEPDWRFWMPLLDNEWNNRHGHVHAVAELPADLLALTVSCKNPGLENNLPTRCWKCRRCQWFKRVKQMLGMGWTPDQIQDYRLERSIAKDGTFVNPRFWLTSELRGEWPDHAEGLATMRLGPHWSSKPFPDEGIWKGLHGVWATPASVMNLTTMPEGG
jgi:hypothetical protein